MTRVAAPKFFGRRMRRMPTVVGWEYHSKRARLSVEVYETCEGLLWAYYARWHGQRLCDGSEATAQAAITQVELVLLNRRNESQRICRRCGVKR